MLAPFPYLYWVTTPAPDETITMAHNCVVVRATAATNTVASTRYKPGLSADIKAKFDAAAVNGAFAVNLTQAKIDPSMLQEYTPVAAVGTVNTDTLDAAAKRIIGNAKVPSILPTESNKITA